MDTMTTKPRGVRNNNPGNIEWGDPWQGLRPENERSDTRFAQFTAPGWGIRALARVLIAYQDKHKLKSIQQMIARWAPPSENNTNAYANAVAAAVGVKVGTPVDVTRYEIMRPMVEAIIRHENGAGPLKTANTWYDGKTIDEGLKLAGVVKKSSGTIATKEGLAAGTAAAAGGTAAIVELSQQLGPMVTQVRSVTSETEGLPVWLRATLIGLTILSAGAALYVFLRKRKEVQAVQA
jgi:hypothetical protein